LIIAGTAIVVGMDLAEDSYDENYKDLAVQHIHAIGGLASKYYNTPEELGGGNHSFKGFSVPDNYMNGHLAFTNMLFTRENIFLLILNSKNEMYKGQPYRFYAFYKPNGLRTLYLFDPKENRWQKVFDRRWDESESLF